MGGYDRLSVAQQMSVASTKQPARISLYKFDINGHHITTDNWLLTTKWIAKNLSLSLVGLKVSTGKTYGNTENFFIF